MGTKLCREDGCERKVASRGWCDTHYRRWLRTGTVDDPARGPTVCKVDACELPVDAKGLCHGHFQRFDRRGDVQAEIPLGRRRQPPTCIVEGCENAPAGRGLCSMHKWRVRNHGRVDPALGPPVISREMALAMDGPSCIEDACVNAAVARDRCADCYKAALRQGLVQKDPAVRIVTGEGHVSHGYWCVQVPAHERHLVGGQPSVGEHRLVMARMLGRPLAPDESVHHVNGNRFDNRPANLELWSRWQPSGQRVEDKIAWARALLQRYRPDLLND